jgi:hypothetical protein
MIKPGGTVDIKVVYFIKDLKEDPSKHKFKFEAVLLDEAFKDKDPKQVFEYFVQNQIKVKGTAVKRGVVFTGSGFVNKSAEFVKQQTFNPQNNINVSKEPIKESRTIIPQSSYNEKYSMMSSIDMQSQKAGQQKEKNIEKNVEDLKIEYYKYKNQLNNLVEANRNLKAKLDMDKTRGDTPHGGAVNANQLNCIIFFKYFI